MSQGCHKVSRKCRDECRGKCREVKCRAGSVAMGAEVWRYIRYDVSRRIAVSLYRLCISVSLYRNWAGVMTD